MFPPQTLRTYLWPGGARVGDPESPPVARGINSVRVLRRKGRWRIGSIVFQIERPGTPIPEKHLPSEPGESQENGDT